jgi:hypothetical protein
MSLKDSYSQIKSPQKDNQEEILAMVIETQDMEEIAVAVEVEEVICSNEGEEILIVIQMTLEEVIVVVAAMD